MARKSKTAKIFIYITLVFIIFASFAAYIVMYAWISNSNKNRCSEWYVWDETIWECVEKTTDLSDESLDNVVLDNEVSCTEAGWTWYEENWICIGANETSNIQEVNEEIVEDIDIIGEEDAQVVND